ncbi:MAG: ABC transporter ATP-binding protein [Haloplanus sp.]
MLELTGLTKRYDGFAFGPVDLTVDDGVLAVLGPSGSGKTTLLSVIAGLTGPDSGTIALDGRSLVGRPPEERGTGLVFQDGALFPHLTARENVTYAATDPERVAELTAVLEIGDLLDRRPAALSGGERQRVALARTLAADPDALLLDEPLSSLDAPIRCRLRDRLHGLFDDIDIPVLYVTHDQRAATVLGDRIAVLRDGGIEQIGPPSVVLHRPDTEFVARFTGCENVFDATVTARDDDGIAITVGTVTVRAAADRPVGSTVTACVRPSRVRLTPDGDGVAGTVRRRQNEGDWYRVVVALDDATLVARCPGDRAVPAPGSSVHVAIPPDTIHLL